MYIDIYLIGKTQKHVIGIDISQTAINVAKYNAKMQQLKNRIKFINSDVDKFFLINMILLYLIHLILKNLIKEIYKRMLRIMSQKLLFMVVCMVFQ